MKYYDGSWRDVPSSRNGSTAIPVVESPEEKLVDTRADTWRMARNRFDLPEALGPYTAAADITFGIGHVSGPFDPSMENCVCSLKLR